MVRRGRKLESFTGSKKHDCFLKDFIYLFLEGGKGEIKRGRETSMCVASHTPLTGDLACNPGMCPDWESNCRPFGSQASTQSTEPHQPGLVPRSMIASNAKIVFIWALRKRIKPLPVLPITGSKTVIAT